ncbi:MAG: hypothetical protein GX548_02640, partial [Lentisphaerae bacterium]|nr:hypothetical protein [Lentisphaerota bacterium]
GLSRLVVAKAGGAVDWFPADGTDYAGENNDIGLATDLGTGHYLVHRGASPFTLSGLTAATDYHIRIYEYQGTNTTLNYNTNGAAGNPSNRYALSTQPSAHAATFTATAASDTEIDLDWGAATGESGFVIVRRAGAAPTGTPANGVEYSQGDALGDGTVVHVAASAGADTVTDSTSTSAGTTYYYRIYPYAYDGTPAHATYHYRTAATVPSDSATTGPAEPATSSTLVSFLPASGSSATVIWTNTGTAAGTIILVKSNAAVDASPADWTGYTADTVFGDGDELGTGNYVVLAAAGSHGSVTVTGLSAGSTYHVAVFPYNGTGSFLNYRTASPATGSVTILPDPSAATATADGKTLIDLAWTKDASYDVMIVHRSGSPSTAPTQGTGYSVGDSVGGGTVIHKGAGAALEHVVASGTAHYYAFYSYNGSDYYSAGVTDSDSTTSFAADDVVETFSYTNSTALTGLNGETGWGGGWYGADIGLFTNSSGSFTEQTNYPAPSGNKLWVYPPENTEAAVFRPLGQDYSSGTIYFGYVVNYTWAGANKYAGLSLFWTNTNEKLFIGEIYGQDQQLGIDSTGSSYTLTAGSGNDYIIVGYYDWAAGEAKAKAYKIGTQAVPSEEPSTWDVTVSKASNTVGTVDTIRLAAGAGATDGTPGNTYFDEVRIATNWSDLIGVLPTKPEWPTNQTVTADGSEMVRLAWTTNSTGHGVMILHKTSAISTDPTDGTGYSPGDTIDGATVIVKTNVTALEHVVTPGTTNHYAFYSYSGANYYSTGVVASATNEAYSSFERVNPFSYTNNTALGASTVGGQGFGGNAWSVNSGTWQARTNNAVAAADVPMFMNMDGYPDMAGNLAWVADPGNGGSATADRNLASGITTGNFYVASMMSYQYYGANKWAGLSLMNGGTEKAFFGKGAGGNWSTLATVADGSTYWSSFDLLPFHSVGGDTGNVYMVVGHYNFESQLLRTKAWKIIGSEFPGTEPSTWDASGTLGTGIDEINRIRLNVGSSDGGATIGRVFFDEIRYGTSWSDLLAVTCPTWAGSNTLNNAEWTAPESAWLGDTESFQFQSFPVGLGQSGGIEFDWGQDGSFSTYHDLPWLQNANNNSYWSNQLQMVAAGSITSRFVAAGTGCAEIRTNNPVLTVQNLNAPSNAAALRDGVNTNSQINLTWDRGDSGGVKDTLVIRQTVDFGWTAPVDGTTYNAGDSLGTATVVYRGAGTSFDDSGLAPDTTYYYRFYAENWTYYSAAYDADSASTAPGGQVIVIDGNPADWLGTAPTVINSAGSSLQEFIWTDKRGDVRTDSANHPNADISEFRVYADADWVYVLVRMTNITDVSLPFVAIGVDTRTNSASTAMNWLGDDSATFIGDGYSGGSAAAHYPEYQINVHHIGATTYLETFAHDGSSWYAPPTGGNTNVAASATHNAIELKVARADLNLSGATTARFTVAGFLNTGSWNNEAGGTVTLTAGTSHAADSLSIPPWNLTDNTLSRSAWEEDISDGDIDFWFDVKFGAAGLVDNTRPAAPVLVTPTNNADTIASPTLIWNSSTDSDGQVTGYLLEISTNEQFNGVSGTENGGIELRVNLDAATTNYTFTTTSSQYWWRVRARDTAGHLSTATTRTFRVVGKLDTEGPQPTLLYIGTNVTGFLAGVYDEHISKFGYIQDVWDSEIRDTNNVFGFVLRWEDPSGVYATNRMRSTDSPPEAGGFAYNIVDTDGRVSPNWDLIEVDTVGGTTNDLWGVDKPFHTTNTLATGNTDTIFTNYVHTAFTVSNYNPDIEYYLTVSAEDGYSEGGSWWEYGSWPSFTNSSASEPYYSGWCEDGPNTARNITTNYLIRINVVDDDPTPPVSGTALGWANSASLVISNATAALDYVEGSGLDVLYEITDGDLVGEPLTFSFNAYDNYFKGVALGTAGTFVDEGRTLTNTSFVVESWTTNWANYAVAMSQVADTTSNNTMMTWHWGTLSTNDITALWGNEDLSGATGITNLIQLHLFDVDNDREDDQASALVSFGRLRVVDDDPDPPVIADMQVLGTGLASEYRLENLVQWTFDGSDPSRLTSTNVASGVTSSPVSLDTGTIIGTDVITVSAGFSTGADRSWLFNLTPASTAETFKATSISFDSRVSSLNGPDTIEIFGTMPSGSETLWATVEIDLSDPDEPVGTNWNGYSTSLTMPAAATNTTQFRIKAHVADTNHLTGTGNASWSIDNLVVSGYILGELGGTQVTDRDLAEGTVRFEASLHDAFSGLYATTQSGRAPRVDFWHADGVPLTNVFFTNGLTADGDATSATTVWGYAPAADKQDIQAGPVPTNHSARFTTDDYDTDRGSDELQTIDVLADVPVYDNDTNAPVRGFKYGSPLGVFVDDTITKAVSSGFTREYRINDEQLQTAAATSITVKINLYDFSGWEVPVLTFSNAVDDLISTNGWLTDLHTTSVDTTNNPDAEMVWTLTKAQADTFFDDYESVVNVFRISSVWDKDDDRHDGLGNNIDRRELANVRIGHLTFLDNDVGQANLQSSWSIARTNWNVPTLYLGDSGDLFASNVLINADVAMPSTNAAANLAIMTNRVYDSQLAKVSADAPLSVVLPTFDTGGGGAGRTVKGVQRGTNLTQESVNTGYDITNTWIGIGTVVVQNASAYDASLSSSEADTRIAARFPTSTWSFTSFSYAEVGHWLNEGSSTQTHALSSGLYDADDNRPLDQTLREVPFGTLLVLDNDTVAPVAPTNLTVNGVAAGGGFTRFTAPWTNQPGFRIGFEPSVDGEPAGTDLEKTGIGEHRVSTQRSDIGPDLGVPLAVPAESSLANYGFESGSTNWALTGAEISTEQACEGRYSLKMTGSTAVQTVRLFNTNAYAPRVTVLGAQFMGAETGTVTIAGLDAAGDPVVGETFDVEIVGSAGIWQSDSSAPTELDASVDRIRVTLTSGAGTYWDDIRVQIELLNAGTPVDETAALHEATDQGLVTNFLFAVDRDNNRPGDRRASSAPLDPVVPEFVTAYDITPPTPVSMPADAASTDFVEDPTTQFDLEWTVAGVGPDDEADTNYPSGYSGTDVLSPWRTYKIYYATFDPMDVPGGDPGHGSTNAYMYTNFIATGVYTNWTSVVSTNAIADPSAAGTNYLAMTNLNQSTIRLYDLETDYDYMVVVAGLDRAGNEGPAAVDSWATNNTVRFSVTSGWTVAKSFAREQFGPDVATNTAASNTMALGWTAAGIKDGIGDVTKHYDLIYWNNSWEGFQESSNNTWQLVSNVKSNWFVDDAGQFKGRGQIRFYRAAQSNRWNKAQFSRPQASEEVYALHNVILSEGYNYVGLHGVPYTNTFAGVFGTDTNLWPAGASVGAGATKVEFYQAGTNVVLTETYWFGTDGNWYPTNSPTPVTHDLQASNFFTRGFSLTLPKPLPAPYHTTNALDNLQPGTNIPAMVWSPIMQVPTNAPGGGGFSHVIHCGVRGGTGTGQWRTNVYNLVSLNLPVGVHPHDMRLIESGFEPAASHAERLNGDHIYFVDTSRKAVGGTKTIYCDYSLLGGADPKSAWKFLDGSEVPDAYFKPNDMIVIVSKNGGLGSTWIWNYHPTNFYNLPTRFMGW